MKIKGSLIVGVSCIILPFILIAMYDSMPKNYYDLVKKHLDEISDTRDEIIVSSTALEIQREKDSLYYIDESNHFVCRKNGDEEVRIEQVFSFLIYEGDIYYTKMKTEGIYCRENGKVEEKKVWDKEVSMFAVGADEEIICTEKEIICFDRQWKEKRKYKLKQPFKKIMGGDCKYIYADHCLLFCSPEGGIFCYSIPQNEMKPLRVPIPRESTEKEVISDIVKRGRTVYYMTCLCEPSDLYTRDNIIKTPKNGVYQVGIETGKFKKVSDDCGFYFLSLQDRLCIADSGFLFARLRECMLEEGE